MSNLLENNAYRILGLDTTASQKEILRRYKEIINRLEISDQPVYELDIDLPKNFRNEVSVKNGLKELQSAKGNIREYFFWFQSSNGNDKKALKFLIENKPTKAIQIWKDLSGGNTVSSLLYKKNLAILYCLILLKDDNSKYLKDSLSIWKEIIDSEKFWDTFSKSYSTQNEQTISEENVSRFKESVAEELSDIYADLGQRHKNNNYVRNFQEVFGTHGKKTEKDVMQPIYDEISTKVEQLKKIKITEEGGKDSNTTRIIKCENCGFVGPDDGFWGYDDNSIICDKCYQKIGEQWTEKVDKKLQKLGIDEDKRKWYATILKIDEIIRDIEKDLSKLRKTGLYDQPASKVVRDRVAEVIRERSVELHNFGALYDDADRLIRVAAKISGTESYKSGLRADKAKIQQTMEEDTKNLLTVEISGFFSSKYVEFKPRFVEYDGLKILYKDATEISLSGIRSNFSTTYTFVVVSNSSQISFSFSNNDIWGKLSGLSEQRIIPVIIKKICDQIFDDDETISIGGLQLSKKGYSRQKFLGGTDDVSWEDKIYIPRFSQGNVVVYKDRDGRGSQFEIIPMSTLNAVILPGLLKECVERAYSKGIYTPKNNLSQAQSTSGTSQMNSEEYYEKIDRAERPRLLREFLDNGGKKLTETEINALLLLRTNGSNYVHVDSQILGQLVEKGYLKREGGFTSTYVIQAKGYKILNWVLYKYK